MIECLLDVRFMALDACGSGIATEPAAASTLSLEESAARLPCDLLEVMRETALNADLERLLELADQSADYDAAFACHLRHLAREYDYQAILDLLPARGVHA